MEEDNDYVLGDRIPSLESKQAIKKMDIIRKKASKMPVEKQRAILEYCQQYVKENSKDGFAYLMISAELVWYGYFTPKTEDRSLD